MEIRSISGSHPHLHDECVLLLLGDLGLVRHLQQLLQRHLAPRPHSALAIATRGVLREQRLVLRRRVEKLIKRHIGGARNFHAKSSQTISRL